MRDLRDYTQLLRVLDNGYFLTHDEMRQVADIVRALKQDADRYRWLNRCTHQLFMVTEEQLNDQIDRAMNGGAGMNEDDDDIQQYVAQRKWVGLTNEELVELRETHEAHIFQLMFAIEAKLKEKNNAV